MLLYIIPLAWGAVTAFVVAACQVAASADARSSASRDGQAAAAWSPPPGHSELLGDSTPLADASSYVTFSVL
ncbi:MAG: hypothetical protein QOF54_1008 [Solirubrobacteraceae bacterium]|jgi:hypothetical protein|nr:hypothetical protein [Solirubrobacteraceae bacterium]